MLSESFETSVRESSGSRRNSLLHFSIFDFPFSETFEQPVNSTAPISIEENILGQSISSIPNLEDIHFMRAEIRLSALLTDCSEYNDTAPLGSDSSVAHDPLKAPATVASIKFPDLFERERNGIDSNVEDDRFKPYHEERWDLRYKELTQFFGENGHTAVPHTYPPNRKLARWVKRQRRQYKLNLEGKASTMTQERQAKLDEVNFIWDSHDVNWQEKFLLLKSFRETNGHCNVPANYVDKKLATWTKCQRRQYKLKVTGKASAMTDARQSQLESLGFEWVIRSITWLKQNNSV